MTQPTALSAFVDGKEVPEPEARALWKDFSEHMDEHRGDMSGFAAKRGWASVAPEYRGGRAVLVVRTTPTAPGLPPLPSEPKKGPARGGAKKRPNGPPPARRRGGPPPKPSGGAKPGGGKPKG